MIDKIQSPEEFKSLATDWNKVLDTSSSDCLFLTWEWLHTWWKHLSENRKLFLLRVSSGDELVAFAPLAVQPPQWSRFQSSSLVFLGTGSVGSDYLDFVIRRDSESAALPEMANYLVRQKAFLNLAQLSQQSASAAGLAGLWKNRGGQIHTDKTNICPVIRLAGQTWDSYLQTLGAEHRYAFRRKLKRLMSRYTVRFEPVVREQDRLEALARLVALHNLRRSSRGGSDAFHTPGLLSFHDEFTKIALQKGWLRLFTLWLDDEPAASLYGFRYKGVFYFYQTGFDPRFSDFGVGLVTMGLAIKSAIEEGAEQYDLLHGAERYKFHWTSQVRELGRLECYPPGLRGEFWKASTELNRRLRKLAHKVLPPKAAEDVAVAAVKGGDAIYAAGSG